MFYFINIRIVFPQSNIVGDAIIKQNRLLRYNAHLISNAM